MRSRFTGRSVHRVLGVLVVALAIGMVMSVAGSSATSASQTGNQAAFKKQYLTYIQQMQNVSTAMRATPAGRAAFAEFRFDPSSLAQAREAVGRMTPAQLAVLQRAHSAYPAWRTIPSRLGRLVDRMRVAPHRRTAMITPNDCAAARAPGFTQTDIEAATDATLIAQGILEAVPSDTVAVGIGVRPAAVLVWAAVAAIQRAFEHLYNIANACDDDDFQTLVSTNLDVKVSTRATQASVDSLTTTFNSLNTLINNRLDVAVSTRASQASLTAFNTEFTNNATVVNTKLDNIQTSVNTANTKLDAANGKLDTTLVKLDTIITKVDQNAATDLRLKIEANLAQSFGQTVIAFMLPEPNGHLGLARDIVLDSIQKLQAAGQGVAAAQTYFGQAETQRSNGNYKKAYQLYSNAYRSAAT